MAEQVILICDDCQRPAIATVKIRYKSKEYTKDLDKGCLNEYLAGATTAGGKVYKSRLSRQHHRHPDGSSPPCPVCGRSGFQGDHGLKMHQARLKHWK